MLLTTAMSLANYRSYSLDTVVGDEPTSSSKLTPKLTPVDPEDDQKEYKRLVECTHPSAR